MRNVIPFLMILMLATAAVAVVPVVTETTEDMKPLDPVLSPPPWGEPDGETLIDPTIGVCNDVVWVTYPIPRVIKLTILVLLMQ